MTAPVAIFAYNRPEHLKKVLDALARNPAADHSSVYIFCDGPRPGADTEGVKAVRKVARHASGFGQVKIVERASNYGLARSILEGVGEVCQEHDRAIVLEDDIVPTPYFLPYVNDALNRYADTERVLSVGCYTFDSGTDLPETFFLRVPDCWGWGVWRRSWKTFEPDGAALLQRLLDSGRMDAFDFEGTYPYTQMLRDCVGGLNQSWAVRWYAHSFLTDSLVLYPRRSVTANIGFDGSGTHGGAEGVFVSEPASRPIVVTDVPIAESAVAREAWRRSFSRDGGWRPGMFQKLKTHLKNSLRS